MNIHNEIKYVFVAIFLFSFNVAITGYINSSFIESQGWSNSIIAGVYIMSSIITLFILPRITRITQKINNRKVMLFFLSLSMASIFTIAFINIRYLQIFGLLLYLILNFLIFFEMDVFVEQFSKKNTTGRIRGIFYTIISFTWAISPLIAGAIITKYGSELIIYMIAMLCVGMTLAIFAKSFKKEVFKKNKIHLLTKTYYKLIQNTDLKNIFFISTVLHTIYASSMIYIPLHLHLIIGISWINIGWLILIANIPYLLFGYLVGFLSDNYIPEKILIITGLIIAAVGTLGFGVIHGSNFWAWSIIFFISRLGLTIIETSSESYLFKKIRHNDTETLSIERSAVPLGFIIAPFIGFLISLLTDNYVGVFIISSLLLLATIYPTVKLHNISHYE